MSNDGLFAFCSENFEIKIGRACKNEVECFPAQIGFGSFKRCANHLIVFFICVICDILIDHFLVSGLEGGVGIVREIGFEICGESGE